VTGGRDTPGPSFLPPSPSPFFSSCAGRDSGPATLSSEPARARRTGDPFPSFLFPFPHISCCCFGLGRMISPCFVPFFPFPLFFFFLFLSPARGGDKVDARNNARGGPPFFFSPSFCFPFFHRSNRTRRGRGGRTPPGRRGACFPVVFFFPPPFPLVATEGREGWRCPGSRASFSRDGLLFFFFFLESAGGPTRNGPHKCTPTLSTPFPFSPFLFSFFFCPPR